MDNVKEGNWIKTLEENKWKIEQIVLKEIESRRETKKKWKGDKRQERNIEQWLVKNVRIDKDINLINKVMTKTLENGDNWLHEFFEGVIFAKRHKNSPIRY